MLAGIIFDFDGVIVDSHPVHFHAWKDFLLSKGKTSSDAELSIIREGAKRETILRHILGDLTPDQIRLFGDEKDELFKARASELKMIGGFVEFLAQMDAAGLPCAVATSGSRRRVEQALATFNLLSRFRALVTGDDVAEGKPNPTLFLKAAQALQIEPDQILVCEDAVAGVLAAKTANMKCLAIATQDREYLLREAGASLVVNDFTQTSLDKVSQLFS